MVAGTGGCFIGGVLALAGHRMVLLGRPQSLFDLAAHGLTLSDTTGERLRIGSNDFERYAELACLAKADLVLATVKTGSTASIAVDIATHAPFFALVIGLQNRVQAAGILRSALPGRDIRTGMVPFNVVPRGNGTFNRATSGEIMVETGPAPLGRELSTAFLPIHDRPDMAPVQWGKLVTASPMHPAHWRASRSKRC